MENQGNKKNQEKSWLKNFERFITKYKSILSLGFLLALMSALVGVSFSTGIALGEKFAIGEVDKLNQRIDVLEKTSKDILIANEALAYISFKNNIEGLNKLEELIDENPDKPIKFLALETKARILIRQGGLDYEVLQIGEEMIGDYPKSYNGYHWRGLARFRIVTKNVLDKVENLPLDTSSLKLALMDFDSSIFYFQGQIKDRINKVESLICLKNYDEAQREIIKAKGHAKLTKDFHVLILDYLNQLCKILKNERDDLEITALLKRINDLPIGGNYNYTSKELEVAFDNLKIDNKTRKYLDDLIAAMKRSDDQELDYSKKKLDSKLRNIHM